MRFDRIDSTQLIQIVALCIVSFGLAIGVCFIAYLDNGGY